MSTIQHTAARKLLPVIIAATRAGQPLNYQLAAERIGRPKDNARMVAQVCDLLDAAAAYAGTPLLALVAVREKSGALIAQLGKNGATAKKSLAVLYSTNLAIGILTQLRKH